MMGVVVTATATFPDLSRAIRKASARQVEERANRYGRQMVETVQELTGRFNRRPASRRRSPGSQHITEGWDYKIAGDPTTYPLFVNLVARGDGAYLQRISYLNDGTPGHAITPRRGQKAWLRYPRGSGANQGPPWTYQKGVVHPGTRAAHFIEITRSNVVGGASARFG